jgi:hypothetical protein
MKPPSFAEPRTSWRTTSVTRVPSPSGSSFTSVLAAAKTRSNGVPSSSCSHNRRSGARDSTTRKSARSERPSWVESTSVKCWSVTPSTRVTRGHQRGRWCGSPTVSHTRSGGAATVRLRRAVGIYSSSTRSSERMS